MYFNLWGVTRTVVRVVAWELRATPFATTPKRPILTGAGLIGTPRGGMNEPLGADFQGLEGGLRRPPFSLVTNLARPDVPIGPETLGRIREALASRGLQLCHFGWVPGARKGMLTLTIDREGGVTLDDCETASRLADEILDADEETPGEYLLEVESPGLDRVLWSLDDCRRFAGNRVRIAMNVPVDGAKRLKGPIEAVEGDALIVMDEDRKRRYTVRFGDVKVVRLIPEF